MKTHLQVRTNIDGIYRFELVDLELDGDVIDLRTVIARAEITGNAAAILADALIRDHHYVNFEIVLTRREEDGS